MHKSYWTIRRRTNLQSVKSQTDQLMGLVKSLTAIF